jgi:hypothetical protein
MADLYSIISGIEPDQQDILEAELLAKQILEAKYPDMDLREGTAIRDLNLRPAAFLLALCKKGFDYYFDQNTVGNITDETPSEIVDDLMSNLFLTRNLGTQSVINVRLYFAREKSVTLTTNNSFSTDGVLLFYPTESATYPSTAMSFDSFHNEYYIDIDLQAAETGTDYNISSGSLLYFSNFDPYFLRGEINYLAQASVDGETNSEFVSRASSAISTRNLVNKPSIASSITQDINYISRIVSIGAGDPEMFRDQVRVSGHTGASRIGTSMVFSDLNLKITINLTNHGFSTGQLINLDETSPGTLHLKSVSVTDIITADSFKILLPITIAPYVLTSPIVTPIEEEIYVHQGGSADVYCIDAVDTRLSQYTLDLDGKCTLLGGIYNLTQSDVSATSTPDTVPSSTPFTVLFPGHSMRSDIALSQSGITNVLTLNCKSHCLVVGRMVKIQGWPTNVSTNYFMITQLVDQDNVILGKDLPLYTPVGVLTPTVTYVDPLLDTGFSDKQLLTVDFGPSFAGDLVSFEINEFKYLDSIQGYLELPERRLVCADLLARGFDIYMLNVGVTVYDTNMPTTGELTTLITEFLNAMTPGDELILADLVAHITNSGINKLKTPLDVTYSYYTKDMFPAQTGVITDVLKPLNSTSIFLLSNVTSASDTI